MLAEQQTYQPRIIGRYALFDEVAHGGMATVHIGRLLGPVGFSRTVAIKRMHAQYSRDPEFVAMFLDEARLAARIRHPNVVQTLDVVALDKEIFLVMEYVLGASLALLFGAGRTKGATPNIGVLTTVMASVLHGLHAAHEAQSERGIPLQIVHRDVSPQNVLVGVDGVPRVLDFGVAKAAHRVQSTQDGQLKGKLSYMAPEQLHGEKVDRRVDVYAAAIVLWEGLTGRKLFAAKTEGLLVSAVLGGATQSPRELNPAVPSKLNDLVMKGLSADPGKRFADAREFALALEQVGSNLPASAIGSWVEGLVGAEVQGSAKLLAEIESISDVMDLQRIRRSARPAPHSEGGETSVEVQVEKTQDAVAIHIPPPAPLPQPDVHSRASAPTLVVEDPRSKPSNRRIATGVALGALLASGLGAGLYVNGRSTPGAAKASSASGTNNVDPPRASIDALLVPASATAPPASSSSTTAPTSQMPASTAPSTPATTLRVSGGATTKPVAATARPVATNKDRCNPPYFFADGIKQIKPGCDR